MSKQLTPKQESFCQHYTTIGSLTFGLRIHHGYIGLLMLLGALLWIKSSSSRYHWIMVFGLSLIFSDLIHHFLVLWPITGSPEFHLVYPNH